MATTHVTDLVAKVIYEQTYGRVWEDATQWARRDSMLCAQSIVCLLGQAHLLASDAEDACSVTPYGPSPLRPVRGPH